MTIGTLTLFALTGSLVLFKLAFMALAVALLARTLLPNSNTPGSSAAAVPMLTQGNATR